jgi:hypothetical protein
VAGVALVGKPARWRLALLVAALVGNVGWVATRLIRPEPEAALTAPDSVATYLNEAIHEGERSLAPYGGLDEANIVALGLQTAGGYDPFQLSAYAKLVSQSIGCDFDGYAVSVPPTRSSPDAVRACPEFIPDQNLLALLNVRYVILPEPTDLPEATLVLTDKDTERYIYDLGPGLGRAFGVSDGQTVTAEECVERLTTVDPREEALVESTLPFEESTSSHVVLSREVGVNTEVFEVRAEGSGLLVRSESWAPGWQATIDSVPTDVLRIDCALQGVWLEDGDHQVRFEYAPITYRVGRWVSLGTLLLLIGAAGWTLWRSGRGGRPDS